MANKEQAYIRFHGSTETKSKVVAKGPQTELIYGILSIILLVSKSFGATPAQLIEMLAELDKAAASHAKLLDDLEKSMKEGN